jgi:hypothetical protein
MEEGQDPHGEVAYVEAIREMSNHFLRTGEVRNFCDGACDPD